MQRLWETDSFVDDNTLTVNVNRLRKKLAGLHLVFACFIVRRRLLMAALDNLPLFVGTACGCFGVFAVVYAVVYRIPSNAYYRLVSSKS